MSCEIKYADAAYPKLSKLVRAYRNYSLLSIVRYLLRHSI